MKNDAILQQSMQKLFDKGNSVLFRWNYDSVWSIDYVSANSFKLFGYTCEEFLEAEMSYADSIHPQYRHEVTDEVLRVIENGGDFIEHKPYKILTKDREEKWVLDQTIIERDEEGEILYFIGYISDITKNIALKDENELLQERLALAIESTHDGIWDWDIKSGKAFFSRYWKSMLGYDNQDILNTAASFFALIHQDDQEKAQKAIERHFQNSDIPYRVEMRLLCKDGSYKWVLARGKVIFDETHQPLRMLGLHVDISHQKEIEKKLKESEFRWKFAIEGSGDGLWDWNLETDEVYFSPQWKHMLGFQEKEISSSIDEWKTRLHPNHSQIVYQNLQEYLDGKSDRYINEHQELCKDGTYKWVLDRGVVVTKNSDGKPLRMIGTHTDIDKHKKIQEKLNRVNKRFKNMFNKHNAIMLLVDPSSEKVIDANLSAQKFYGYSLEEFKALSIYDLNTASREEISRSKQQALNNEVNCFEFEHMKKDGQKVKIETHTSTIESDQGDILFSVIMDVTQKKENEKRLKHVFQELETAQKIAKLGLWEFHHNSQILEWSQEVYNIFEIDADKQKASNELFVQRVHPNDRDEVTTTYANSILTKEPFEITHRLLLEEDRVKYVLEQGNTTYDDAGAPLITRGIVQDITEFEMLDITMRNERKRFKTFMDNASDGILIINQDLRLIDFSKVAQKMLGYSDKEMRNLYIKDWDIHIGNKELATLTHKLSSTPMTFETIHQRKDGSRYDAAITAVSMELEGQKYIYAAVRDISEIKKLQDAILYEKNFIETIIESASAIIIVINSEGRMIKLNSYAEKFTGYKLEELSKEPYQWTCVIPAEEREKVISMLKNGKKGDIQKHYQNAWHSKSGEVKMFEWSNTLVTKKSGEMDYMVSIGIDITKNEEQQAFLNLLINSQSHMIILADGHKLKYANQAVLEFFGVETLRKMQELHKCICDSFIENDFSFHLKKMKKGEKWMEAIQELPVEKRIVSLYSYKEAKEKTFKVNVENYDNRKMYLITFIDISDTMKKQFELEYKSNHDPLTKAFNREYFYDNWSAIRESHRMMNQLTAVAMIDIDHFKVVNDTYGHDVGDEVLKRLVGAIENNSRESDILIRWGGEEFILLIPVKNESNLSRALEYLRAVVSKEYMPVAGHITISIGASIYERIESIEECIKIADKKLYISKKNGRNRVTI